MAEPSSTSSAGAPIALASTPKEGDLIGAYRVESVIQQGGMGEVFLVSPSAGPADAAPVVLKRLPLHGDDEDGYAGMFQAETEVMSRLRHPNIVSVLDSFNTEGEMCLALEFVRGRNLLQLQRACHSEGVTIPPGVSVHIMAQVLEGLHYAHTFVLEDGRPLGLVHRDVTPGNILVSFDGVVKVTDFGIAKSVMSRVATRVGVVKGTTRYLSPEQIRASAVTPRSDVFSSTVVLTELLTGQPLFDRGAVAPTLFAIVNQERPDVASLLPFAAPELAQVLESALATDPEQRPPSALAMAESLRRAAKARGWAEGKADVAALMKRLFPESETAPDAVPPTVKTSAPRLDLTYLLEVSEPRPDADEGEGDVEEELRALLQGMVSGASPLDASQFARHGQATPAPGHQPPAGLEPPEDTNSKMLAMTVPARPVKRPNPPPPPSPPLAGFGVPAPTPPPPLVAPTLPVMPPAPEVPPPSALASTPPPLLDSPTRSPTGASLPPLGELPGPSMALPPEDPIKVPVTSNVGSAESRAARPPRSRTPPPPPPPADSGFEEPALTPTDVGSRAILDAIDHVSSEIEAMEVAPLSAEAAADAVAPPAGHSPSGRGLGSAPIAVGPSSEGPTMPGAAMASTARRWPRDVLMLVLGLGLGVGGTLGAPTALERVGLTTPNEVAPLAAGQRVLAPPSDEVPTIPAKRRSRPIPVPASGSKRAPVATEGSAAAASAVAADRDTDAPSGAATTVAAVGSAAVAPPSGEPVAAAAPIEIAPASSGAARAKRTARAAAPAAAPKKKSTKAKRTKSAKRSKKKTPRGYGYLTVLRPRGARVYVDDSKIRRRVPFRKVRIKMGKRKVKITKGKYRRVFDINLPSGDHLDVTGGRVKTASRKRRR